MMLNEMPCNILHCLFMVALLPTTKAQVLSMGSNVQNHHPLGGALIVGGSLNFPHGESQKVQFSSASQIGQPQPAQVNQPQRSPIGRSQKSQKGHSQPVQIDHLSPAHAGQLQTARIGQLQHTQIGQSQPAQIDLHQPAQIHRLQPVQIDHPSPGYPPQAQTGQSQPVQIGQPQLVQTGLPKQVKIGLHQSAQISQPQPVQRDHPSPSQTGQPQPAQIGQLPNARIDQPQPVQILYPPQAQTGQSQPVQIGQPQPIQIGLPRQAQISQPQPIQRVHPPTAQSSQPQPVQIDQLQHHTRIRQLKPKLLQIDHPTQVQTGQSKPVQIGQPQPVQIGLPQPEQIGQPQPVQTGLHQPAQISQPQPVQRDHPPTAQTSQLQPAQIDQLQHHTQIKQLKPKLLQIDHPTQLQTGQSQPAQISRSVQINHSSPAQTGQLQSIQIRQLQHTGMGHPQPVQRDHALPAQIGQPKPVHIGQPQPISIGLPQQVQIGEPEQAQIGQSQPVPIGLPQPTVIGRPQPVKIGHPPLSHTGQSQPFQIGQPQPVQNDLLQPSSIGLPKPVQIDYPSLSHAGKPQPLQIGQPQPVQIGLLQPAPIGLPQPVQIGRRQPAQIGPSQPTHVSQPELLFQPFNITNKKPIFQFPNHKYQITNTNSKPFVSSNNEKGNSTSVSDLMHINPTHISLNKQLPKSRAANNTRPKKNETYNQPSLPVSGILPWIDHRSFSTKPKKTTPSPRPNNAWNNLLQRNPPRKKLMINKQPNQSGHPTMSSYGNTFEITTGKYLSHTSMQVIKEHTSQTEPTPPWSQPQTALTSPSPVTAVSRPPINNTGNVSHRSKPSSAWTEVVPSRFQTPISHGSVQHSVSVVPQERHQRHLFRLPRLNDVALNTAKSQVLTTTALPWAQPRKPGFNPSILSTHFRQAPVFANINDLFQSNPSILSFGSKLPKGLPPLPISRNTLSETSPPTSVSGRAISLNNPSVPATEHALVSGINFQTTSPTPSSTGYYNQLINVKDLPTGGQLSMVTTNVSGFNGQVSTTTPPVVLETILSSLTKAQEQLSINRLEAINVTTNFKGHLWMLGRTTDGPLHKKIRTLNRIAEFASLTEKIYMSSTSAVPIDNNATQLDEWRTTIAPFCNYTAKQYQCNPKEKYRTADGSCNNINNPDWGSSLRKQKRYLPAAYTDGKTSPRELGVNGTVLPSARNISTTVHTCGACNETSKTLTVMMAAFGQILKNDLFNTPAIKGDNNAPVDCCIPENINNSACFSIEIPDNDTHFVNESCMSYVRSATFPSSHCDPGVREQINQITSFLDASFLYGYTKRHQKNLRLGRYGLMKMGKGHQLPPTTDSHCIVTSPKHNCFKSGDPRSQENPMVTILQLLFIREHNRIAKILALMNRHWGDDRIFEETRRIVIAELQHITYSEYLPILLGRSNMRRYRLQPRRRGHDTVYNSSIDATITNAFGAAAFQFWSTEMPDYMTLMNSNFKVASRQPLETQFYKSDLLFLPDSDSALTRWMVSDAKQLLDRKLQNSVRNSLYMDAMGNSFDLASMIIQRGRDHGIPPYNQWRRWCGLKPADHFGDGIGGLENHDAESRLHLSNIYSHPDDIDLYTGGLSEIKTNGADVGPTFACIIANQFRELKVGDRFWYENKFQLTGFSKAQINQIKRINLAYIVCKNMNLKTIQPSAFYLPIRKNFRRPCESLGKSSLKHWKEKPTVHRRV